MTDLRFVCVRADLELAEALADIFETAGFSVSDSDDDTARVSIIVWSDAAERSRAFVEAARSAADASRTFIVSIVPVQLLVPDRAPVFDLSKWKGDPESSAIDPLVAAIDRAVRVQEGPVEIVAEAAGAESEPEAPAPIVLRAPRAARRVVHKNIAALAALILGVGGVLTASFALTAAAPPTRIEIAPAPTAAPLETIAPAELEHVQFADIVLVDPPPIDVEDEVAAVVETARHGVEPPSAFGVQQRAAAPTRYAARSGAAFVPASYTEEASGPLELTAPSAPHPPSAAKHRAKPETHA